MYGSEGGTCLAFFLSVPQCNPNKYSHTLSLSLSHTQGNRAGTLTEMEQNRPFSREQNHRGEEACGAYWYSFQLIFVDTDTLLLRAHTAKQEENQRGESKSDGEHIFDCRPKADPASLSLFICISQLPMWPRSDCKTFLKRPNSEQSHQNKLEEGAGVATGFEVLSFLND